MPIPDEQQPLTGHEVTNQNRESTFKEKLKQPRFWLIWLLRLVVFSVTGSLSVRLTSLFVHNALGMDGTFVQVVKRKKMNVT
jgi:hypothetical protein